MANKKKVPDNVITGLVYIVLGILFMIFRSNVLSWIMTIIGVLFLVRAVISLMDTDYTSAIVYGVLGLLAILGGWLFLTVILIIFGVVMIFSGAVAIYSNLKSKNYKGLIAPIITLVVGILLITSGFTVVDWFFIVFGVIFIADGAVTLFLGDK